MKTASSIFLFLVKRIITRKYSDNLCKITLFAFVALTLQNCGLPDGAAPGDRYVTSGASILTINDDAISTEIKNKIYQAPAGYVSQGSSLYNSNLPLIIIPYRFQAEFPFNTSVNTDTIRNNFFTRGNGSVHDYFYENSWGQFDFREGFIANLVTLAQNPADYAVGQVGGDWTRNSNVHKEICEKSNVNWASFDRNGNRIIEENEAQVCFLASIGGGGATRGSTVSISTSAGNYSVSDWFVFFDCKRNNDPTKGVEPLKYNYSTIWHELAHGMFHLPDRYADFCGSGKTGKYDLMSDNCSWRHMNIWDKMKIGWIRPKILGPGVKAKSYTFPSIETTPAALVLLPSSPSTPDAKEYWVIENRNKVSSPRNFDRDIPASGMAIWWVDEDNDVVTLVDGRNYDRRPNEFTYSAYDDQIGTLFKYQTGDSLKVFSIVPKVGSGFRIFRGVSPDGTDMRAEF